MKTFYQIQTNDWNDNNLFATLSDAKSHIIFGFSEGERIRYFNEYHGAKIYKIKGEDVVSCTPFHCDEKGTHYGKTVKIIY